MDFDIVIVTRNRQRALEICVPLVLSQERRPARLIIVDASDDHQSVCRIVEQAAASAGGGCDLRIVRSDPGMTYQRNLGLKHVTSPVIMFPDDDALWHPGVSSAIMAIYERDGEGMVGGVGGQEWPEPPPGALIGKQVYRMELRDRMQLSVGRLLDSLEYRLLPDPFFIEGRARYADKRLPSWLAEQEATPATTFPGFRMSFRTEVIRRTGFDEMLGRYALFEDYDACLGVLKTHILVDAAKARVFHYRSPEKRVNGMEWGIIQIMNRAYLICKHSPPGSLARRRVTLYSLYKLLRYLLQAYDGYGRDRVRGVMEALPIIPQFLNCPGDDLTQRYITLRNTCLSKYK